MLVFIICILLCVGCLVGVWYADRNWSDLLFAICGVMAALAFIVVVVFGIVGLGNVFGAEAEAAKLEQTYNSLTYQLENEIYDNDNDIGKKELYSEVAKWNEDIAYGKEMQDNIWVGMLYKNIYDDFELIELGK